MAFRSSKTFALALAGLVAGVAGVMYRYGSTGRLAAPRKRKPVEPPPPPQPLTIEDVEHLLPAIDKQIEEGGGWANVKRLPGGTEVIDVLIDNGILEEDGGFVRRRRKALTGGRRLAAPRKRKSDKLRDQDTPTALDYELDRETLTPKRDVIDTSAAGDYGADPVGDGTFRMVPSGDIVDFDERNRRLARFKRPLRGAKRGEITDAAALKKRLTAVLRDARKRFADAETPRDVDAEFSQLRRRLDDLSRDSSGFFPEANDMNDAALRTLIEESDAARAAAREGMDKRLREAVAAERAAKKEWWQR